MRTWAITTVMFLSFGSGDVSPEAACGASQDVGAPQPGPLVVTRLAMGVRFQIAIVGNDDIALTKIAEAAFHEVDQLERIFNNWSTESAISHLNQNPTLTDVPIPRRLSRLLADGLAMSERTSGAYDMTIGPALRIYGFHEETPRKPTDHEVDDVRRCVGASKLTVSIERSTVTRAVMGMEIDVSSAAKGAGVDAAVAKLRELGVTNAFVAAGGSTVYAIGAGRDGEGWPFRVAPDVTLQLRDESLSTSGKSWRDMELEGKTLRHIFDPRTLHSSRRDVAKASFRGPSATEADMASTALVVLGVDGTREWFARDASLRGKIAYLEDDAGELTTILPTETTPPSAPPSKAPDDEPDPG